MRLSNPLLNAISAIGCIPLALLALSAAGSLFDAATGPPVFPLGGDMGAARISFQAEPVWYVVSVVVYAGIVALPLALLFAILADRRNERALRQRMRSAPRIDSSVRQSAEER
jgi:hypothetical protein